MHFFNILFIYFLLPFFIYLHTHFCVKSMQKMSLNIFLHKPLDLTESSRSCESLIPLRRGVIISCTLGSNSSRKIGLRTFPKKKIWAEEFFLYVSMYKLIYENLLIVWSIILVIVLHVKSIYMKKSNELCWSKKLSVHRFWKIYDPHMSKFFFILSFMMNDAKIM